NATAGWLDENKIRTSQARLFINCARGSIANEQALLENKSVRGSDFILDVWNNEPVFDDEVAHSAFIGTPHIAGYSLQGKLKATHMVTRALHHHFNLPDPGIDQAPVVEAVTGLRNSSSLTEILNRIHPVQQYYGQFKLLLGLPGDEKMIRFRRLRNDISLRNEFKHMRIQESLLRSNPLLRTLGLKSLSD
ncbi:MAG: NAD(P)-dependent oxidoreductase, partial [Balneolales bacterium]